MAQGQRIDQLFWDLGANTAPLMAGVGAAQGKLRKFAAFMKTPIGALAALGAAAVIAGAKATAMAAEFDKALREVSTLLPVTVREMVELREAIVSLSTRVPAPPVQLTAGLYQVISAGVTDTAEAMFVLEVASKAATAGLSDATSAVSAITTVLNAYQLEASEATRVSDVFFATVAQGVITFPEIAATIGNVASTAALAGVSIEVVGAAMATLTKGGLNAAEATTALNKTILGLIDDQSEAAELAREMGIEYNFATLQSRGLIGAMEVLNEATEGNVQLMQQLVPELRAFKGVSILAGTGLENFRENLEATTNSAGASQKAFDKMVGALDAQWKLLKNKVNVAWLKFGTVTLPAVTMWLKILNTLLGETTDHTIRALSGLAQLSGEELNQRTVDAVQLLQKLREERDALRGAGRFELGLSSGEFLDQLNDVNSLITQQQVRINALAVATEALAVKQTKLVETTSEMVAVGEPVLEGLRAMQQEAANLALSLDAPHDAVQRFADKMLELAEATERARDEARELTNQNMADNSIRDAIEDVEQFIDVWAKAPRSIASNVTVLATIRARLHSVGLTVDDLLPSMRRYVDMMEDGAEGGDEFADSMGEITSSAFRAARALIDAGRAMGIFGSESSAALNSVANITESIIALTAAGISTGGIFTAIGGIVAGLGALGGALFGGGDKVAATAQKENTEAIRLLTSAMLNQLLDQPIGEIFNIQAAIEAARIRREEQVGEAGRRRRGRNGDDLIGDTGTEPQSFMDLFIEELLALGLTMDDVRRIISGLGLELVESAEGFAKLAEELAALDLSRALSTFTGQLGLLRREFALFDITDPVEKVKRMLGVLDAFTDLDVPDLEADGAAAVEEFIQGFFNGLQDLTPEEMAARFGGLSINQILDLMGDIESLLDGVEDGAADGVTRGFQVSRTITEVTGNRLVGTMTTVSFWAERTALAVEAQLVLMGGGLRAPTRTELNAAGVSTTGTETFGSISVGPITIGDIIVTGVTDPGDTAEVIARDLTGKIDRALGKELQNVRRARGLAQPDGLRN